ncbi:MAG: sodium:proton antiporter NhaD [Pseudarcicella sp.]|nr:sodium:proton antiporter NhaD [Pseudarcicella sp.]MBP6410804.1 sodium:proton antiporter NhaD [Pseudarcicella sp.]
MLSTIVFLFVLGYIAIVFEHSIKINKTAIAILTGVLTWVVFMVLSEVKSVVSESLSHHLSGISEILFFLLGAMTIVELVDAHGGFSAITKLINNKNKGVLLVKIAFMTFFLSAVLDNLTSAIVMVTVLRKLISNASIRKYFVAIVVVAANAGGAWSPIGDVTTTMLWVGGQISATGVMKSVFFPSIFSLLVPLCAIFYVIKKHSTFEYSEIDLKQNQDLHQNQNGNLMLASGVGLLLFVPIFKTLTGLPPYMGILLGLGLLWLVSEFIHADKDDADRKPYTVSHALSKIDTSSILFFWGILMAVAVLESTGLLKELATGLSVVFVNQSVIVLLLGLFSAVIDNVPLVAASMGMYHLQDFPTDAALWQMVAYCAGTGGSILIIGSAAGVAVMGMEKIDFVWYLKKISFWILLGYLLGFGVFVLQNNVF